ncbi:hypothetical protein [Streptomyces sp. NPDC047014]|uniref:hypothetical protein n=1 Tax=Streptomyces sp. NPDC047014 TaxID=3155736 RepID=UPI0033D9F849
MAPTRPAPHTTPYTPQAPLYVHGPDGPWEEVQARLEDTGRAVVCATWGEWMTAVLLDPALRPLLGEDWPRFRRTPQAAARMRFAVSRHLLTHTAALALDLPAPALRPVHGPAGRLRYHAPDGSPCVETALAHSGELVVAGVSRTGPLGLAAEPATPHALPGTEHPPRLRTLRTARTQALGPATGEGSGTAPPDTGQWQYATHLLHGRYLIAQAHRTP